MDQVPPAGPHPSDRSGEQEDRLHPRHGGRHRLDTGSSAWRSHRGLQAVLIFVVAAAVATVSGTVTLWPTEEGVISATESAAEIGLATERYAASVLEVRDGPCSYSNEDNPRNCRHVTAVLDEGPAVGSAIALTEFDL
ncbi:MAG: hypothetical protein OXM62_05010, partial [bacterium]|nr:hypothetical protein [bacterium]